jgi:hypothetical protein
LGITGVDVQDESGSLGEFTGFNFLGSGVTAADAGGGVANVTISQGAVPYGIITMWYGTSVNVPVGWSICDGTNGTPDLRSRFVHGAQSDGEVGTLAGGTLTSNTGNHNHSGSTGAHPLTLEQIPSHTHRLWGDPTGDNDQLSWGWGTPANTSGWIPGIAVAGKTPAASPTYINTNVAGASLVEAAGGVQPSGAADAHDHTIQNSGAHVHSQSLPPHAILYYIMKI